MHVKMSVKFCLWEMEGMLIFFFNASAEINQDIFWEPSDAYWGERHRKLYCRCLPVYRICTSMAKGREKEQVKC